MATVIQWILDTRSLWPEAKETKDLSHVASRALALLSEEERAGVLRYYFVRDAKLSLGSSLLKRLVIARHCGVGWADATFTRDERGKPVFRHPRPESAAEQAGVKDAEGQDGEELIFNLSHQAGIVMLFAVHRPQPGTSIGVDVVCTAERRARDLDMIRRDGWAGYVSVHADVLHPLEVSRLLALPAHIRLERFYALWCAREAYVKMTGEALVAPWLRDLDMRNCVPEGPEQVEVWLRGERVEGVKLVLRRAGEVDGEGYMLCVAVRGDVAVGRFDVLDMDWILDQAESL